MQLLHACMLAVLVQVACLVPPTRHGCLQIGLSGGLKDLRGGPSQATSALFYFPLRRLEMRLRGGAEVEAGFQASNASSATENQQIDDAPRDGTPGDMAEEDGDQSGNIQGDDDFHILQEGAAKFQVARGKVFYNKAMVVNRDLSILVLRYFVETRRKEIREAEQRRFERAKAKLEAMNISATAATGEGTYDENTSVSGIPSDIDVKDVFEDGTDAAAPPEGIPGKGDAASYGQSDPPVGVNFRPFRVLDAMSASGLRALRYALEVPDIGHIVANDLDPSAAAAIRRNMALNGLGPDAISPKEGDAAAVLLAAAGCGNASQLFEVVDLDPFGSAAPLLSAAVHGVANGGMLCVTCTDMRVLAGQQPDACFTRYGSVPVRAPYSKELAVRILLHAIQAAASPLGKAIEAVLSVSIDFYVRVFVRVRHSRAAVQQSSLRTALLYHCTACESFCVQPLLQFRKNTYQAARGPPPELAEGGCCGVGPVVIGGPMWAGPTCDPSAVQRVRELLEAEGAGGSVASRARLGPLLTLLAAELPSPLFMSHRSMSKVLKCSPPKLSGLRALVQRAGFNVSLSHIDPQALKTDAPPALLWDLYRVWLETHGGQGGSRSTPAGARIAAMPIQMLNQTLLNATSTFALRFDWPDPCHEAALNSGPEAAAAGAKRGRQQLYPKTEGYGPKRSVGVRGKVRVVGGLRERQEGGGQEEELLPGGMGLPEGAAAVQTWGQVGGEEAAEEREEAVRTVDWMRRRQQQRRGVEAQQAMRPPRDREQGDEVADGAESD